MASKAPRSAPCQPRRRRIRSKRRDTRLPQPLPSLAALLTVIPSLSRAELGRLVHRMIGHMDDMDGDTDLEPNGDELDGSLGEDDFCDHNTYMPGPGCPVSDPDYGGEELGEIDDGDIGLFADPEAYREQTNRLRRDRCYPVREHWRERGEIRSRVRYHRLFRQPQVPTKRQLLKRKRGVPRRPRP